MLKERLEQVERVLDRLLPTEQSLFEFKQRDVLLELIAHLLHEVSRIHVCHCSIEIFELTLRHAVRFIVINVSEWIFLFKRNVVIGD